jgi:tetratricopeptide (TPR) repeat protein
MKKAIFLICSLFFIISATAQDMQSIYYKSMPSLVTLRSVDDLGYGFFVDKDLVVTNYQVINKARMGAAKAVLNDGTSLDVTGYVAASEELNLVILKVNAAQGIPLELAQSAPVADEKLYLFLHKNDGTLGIGEGSVIEMKDFGTIKLIQIGASVVLQNSGLPVLSAEGHLLGISVPSPILDTNYNFAIPTEKIRELLSTKKDIPDDLKTLNPPKVIQTENREKSALVSQYINQGNTRLLAKDYKGAIEKFSNAIRLAPSDPDAYVFRGQAKVLLLQYKDALDDFNKAIDIEPNFAEAYDLRGVARAELGDKTGACEDWEKSYELGFNEAFQLLREFCDVEKDK